MICSSPSMGVVLVSYNSGDVILDCLESLLNSTSVALEIVVVDNGSTDETLGRIRAWASGQSVYSTPSDSPVAFHPVPKPVCLSGQVSQHFPHRLRLLPTGKNSGYAGGVNHGLRVLEQIRELDRFWILNPDSIVAPNTAAALVNVHGSFSLLGGRVAYYDAPDQIQIDGGTIRWWSGTTHNMNQFRDPAKTPTPDPGDLDFITGASMVASRSFLEAAGPMPEDYFLYYEEVDWALRRGKLPLAICSEAVVFHRAGTSIGSPAPGRPASVFSLYFKHRARLKFLRRYRASYVPTALLFSLAKAVQLALKGHLREARVVLASSFDLPPPSEVTSRLTEFSEIRGEQNHHGTKTFPPQ